MKWGYVGDAFRIASSVLFATVGVVEAQTRRTNETRLIRAIAGEVHSIARTVLLSPPHLELEGKQLQRGSKRLHGGDVAQ